MKKIFSILVFLPLLSCNSDPVSSGKLDWLQGNWIGNYPDMKLYESWNYDGAVLSGKASVLAGNDTVFAEKMRILQQDGETIYEVELQGDPQKGFFKLKNYSGDSAIFIRDIDDFPARIVYIREGDSLLAYIDGIKEGKYTKENFSYSIRH
jgi:hypothetical protein